MGKITKRDLSNSFKNEFHYSSKLDIGMIGDGIVNDAIVLNTWISSIGSTKVDLVFSSGTYLISTNVSFPANVNLIFNYGAILKISNGIIITGNYTRVEAGLFQIFDTTLGGSIAGTWKVEESYLEWFGENADTYYNDALQYCWIMSRKVILLNRDYNFNEKIIYLNPSEIHTTYELESRLYELGYAGTGIKLYGFPDVDQYLIKINENSSGERTVEFPSTRLIIKNVEVWNVSATNPNFIWTNQASLVLENMMLGGLLNGVKGTGYIDQIKMSRVQWFPKNTTGNYLLYKNFSGDSLILDQIMGLDTDMIYLESTHGAKITACNGGHYHFVNSSTIEFSNAHMEFQSLNHGIIIQSSVVNISNCSIRNDCDLNTAPIYINDLVGKSGSQIILENNSFPRNITYQGARSHGDIYIKNLENTGARIIFKNNKSTGYRGTGTIARYVQDYNISVLADSALTSLNTRLLNYRDFSNDSMIIEYDSGAWRYFNPETKPIVRTLQCVIPTFTSITDDTEFQTAFPDPYDYIFASGTYYYRCHSVSVNRNGLRSIETSVVKVLSGSNISSIKLIISGKAGTLIKLQRGTSTGVYDKEIIVKMVTDNITLIDGGKSISGLYWGSISAALSTVQSTGNGTYDQVSGQFIFETDDSILSGANYYTKGSILKRIPANLTIGYPAEYVFISDGVSCRMTKQFGMGKGTTANRPSISGTVIDVISHTGLQYLDTTLDADGKLIIWNGSAWVDSTGAVV